MSSWAERSVTGHRPPQRGGHATAAIFLKGNGKEDATTDDGLGLVVIGGADAFGAAYNDVLLFEVAAAAATSDATNNTAAARCVQLQQPSSSCPFTARMGHSAHAVSPSLAARMAAVAASFPTGAAIEELADGEEGGEASSSPPTPPPAAAASSNPSASSASPVRYCDPIVVFGGMSAPPAEAVHNTVFLLRVDADYNSRIAADAAKKVRTSTTSLVSWEVLGGCSGAVPPPRHSHAASIVGDELVVIGGSDGNQPLDDGFALNLITRVWRRLDLRAAPPTAASPSSSSSSPSPSPMAAREMASMAAHPLLTTAAAESKTEKAAAEEVPMCLLTGGRDSDGLMLGDALVLSPTFSTATASAPHLSCLFDEQRHRRCCHAVLPSLHSKLGPVFLCVGGFTPDGMPLEDAVVSVAAPQSATPRPRIPPIAVPRKLAKKPRDELHFGLGHSAAASVGGETVSKLLLRSFVVTGIIPNTVGGSMAIYELLMDRGESEGAAVAAEAPSAEEATARPAPREVIEGLL